MLENRYRGNQIHPACYRQPYKIKRIGYYPAITLVATLDIKKKKRFPLTDMVLAKQEEIACSQKVGHIIAYFPERSQWLVNCHVTICAQVCWCKSSSTPS